MSIGYSCIMEKKLVISVWHEAVSLNQWQENLNRLLADPDFTSTSMQITDMRSGYPDDTIGEIEIQQVIDSLGSHRAKIAGRKVAIVAGRDFKKPKLFERLAEAQGVTVIVFNDFLGACSWLNIDPTETEQSIQQIHKRIRGKQ